MKTEELISTLVADQRRVAQPLVKSLVLASILAVLLTFGALFVTIGVRNDLLEAATSWRFLLKLTIVKIGRAHV